MGEFEGVTGEFWGWVQNWLVYGGGVSHKPMYDRSQRLRLSKPAYHSHSGSFSVPYRPTERPTPHMCTLMNISLYTYFCKYRSPWFSTIFLIFASLPITTAQKLFPRFEIYYLSIYLSIYLSKIHSFRFSISLFLSIVCLSFYLYLPPFSPPLSVSLSLFLYLSIYLSI